MTARRTTRGPSVCTPLVEGSVPRHPVPEGQWIGAEMTAEQACVVWVEGRDDASPEE